MPLLVTFGGEDLPTRNVKSMRFSGLDSSFAQDTRDTCYKLCECHHPSIVVYPPSRGAEISHYEIRTHAGARHQ